MSLDIIKEYLVSIGFQIDSNSLQSAEQGISSAEQTIKKFNDSNNKGFSESSSVMRDFFSLLSSSSNNIGTLFPSLQGPFKNLIRDITVVKKMYDDISKEKKPQESNKNSDNKKETKFKATKQQVNPKPEKQKASNSLAVTLKNTDLTNNSENLIEDILSVKESSKSLAVEGGSAFKAFATSSLGSIAAVAAGVVVAALAVKGLVDFLGGLAKQDIENEKLSRQLWTTKENAKEVSMALDTMGATMQDLWLSPTLMKQFTQLRKDSAALKLPADYANNIKIVQGIGLEFSRTKQLGTLAFQQIGSYIIKYLAGPLAEIKQGFKSFNDSLIKNIPNIAKVIGTAIGVVARILLTVAKVIGTIISVVSKVASIIGQLLSKIPAPLQKIMKIIALIGLLIMAGPVGAIIALIAALDDLFTYLRGGKSVMGSFFDGLFGKKEDKKVVSNVGNKVKDYNSNSKINATPSYASTTNSNLNSTTTSNSNNQIANNNTIKVYGSSNPTATGNATAKALTGLTQRNLQGVIN